MNFSSGSRAPRSSYTPRNGSGFDINPVSMKAAGVTTNAGSAADAVSTSSIYGELRANSPKYADMAATAAENRMNERVSAMNAEANMANAGINTASQIERGKHSSRGNGSTSRRH